MKNSIKDKVDKLGNLLRTISELEKEVKVLKEEIITNGEGTYEGLKYTAIVIKSICYELNKEKLFKHLGKNYVKVSKPMMTEVKKYIAGVDLQKFISDTKESYKVNIKEKTEEHVNQIKEMLKEVK